MAALSVAGSGTVSYTHLDVYKRQMSASMEPDAAKAVWARTRPMAETALLICFFVRMAHAFFIIGGWADNLSSCVGAWARNNGLWNPASRHQAFSQNARPDKFKLGVFLKKFYLSALVLCCGLAVAQTTPAKKELVAKILVLQQNAIEQTAQAMAERPALQMMQQANMALQTRVAPDKREAIAKDIQADVKKYVDEVSPVVRQNAVRLAPSTVGALLDQRFSEDELKPVSYTHLDVYKRQPEACPPCCSSRGRAGRFRPSRAQEPALARWRRLKCGQSAGSGLQWGLSLIHI